jgi:hypothetical protein
MATVLCVWELGTDLGHLSALRLPVEVALAQGHRVVMALKEGHNIRQVFGDWPIKYLQAPFRKPGSNCALTPIPSFTHLLIRQCFDNQEELAGYLRAWSAIFDSIKPDIVLFEHSPTALIAAYGCRFKKVLVGNGFTAPPGHNHPGEPWLPFPTTTPRSDVLIGLMQDDLEVLKLINSARSQLELSELPSMHAIYGQVDDYFLMTWPALDAFGPRTGVTYLGIESPQIRTPPRWPGGNGPRVFGYLHSFPSVLPLLRDLQSCRARAVLFIRHLAPELRVAFQGSGLEFVDQPVDLSQVAREADWVITHGNHSTAAHFASRGVPQLVIPLHQEQLFLARNLERRGAAVIGYQDQEHFANLLGALSKDYRYRQNAVALAQECDQNHTRDACAHIERRFQLLTETSI